MITHCHVHSCSSYSHINHFWEERLFEIDILIIAFLISKRRNTNILHGNSYFFYFFRKKIWLDRETHSHYSASTQLAARDISLHKHGIYLVFWWLATNQETRHRKYKLIFPFSHILIARRKMFSDQLNLFQIYLTLPAHHIISQYHTAYT